MRYFLFLVFHNFFQESFGFHLTSANQLDFIMWTQCTPSLAKMKNLPQSNKLFCKEDECFWHPKRLLCFRAYKKGICTGQNKRTGQLWIPFTSLVVQRCVTLSLSRNLFVIKCPSIPDCLTSEGLSDVKQSFHSSQKLDPTDGCQLGSNFVYFFV